MVALSRFLKHTFGVMILGAGIAAPAMGQEKAAAGIVKEIEAIKLPEPDPSRAGDVGYLREFKARRSELRLRRAELIAELYRADTEHPKLVEWMPMMRWLSLSGRLEEPDINEGAKDLTDELDGVLASPGHLALKREAAYVKAWILGNPFGEFGAAKGYEAQSKAAETFIATDPKDQRGANLLGSFVLAYPGEQDRVEALCRRIVRDYPDSVEAVWARRRIAKREATGKPFELTFRDAIGGSEVSTRALRGKIIVVDFWATWCAPCVAELPRLKELHAKYSGKGVAFLGVSHDFPEEQGGLTKLKQFVAKNEIPWPQYYENGDSGSTFSDRWGISSIPALFVIDQDGKVVSTNAREKLEPLLLELLAKQTAADAKPAGR